MQQRGKLPPADAWIDQSWNCRAQAVMHCVRSCLVQSENEQRVEHLIHGLAFRSNRVVGLYWLPDASGITRCVPIQRL